MAESKADTVPPESKGLATIVWSGILVVYVALFVATGYVAFFVEEYNPAINIVPEVYMNIEDPETKSLFIDTLKQEADTHQKKRELAAQSFNVVLGALLGFLSASAASGFGRQNKTQ